MDFNDELANVATNPILVATPFAFLAVQLENVNDSVLVAKSPQILLIGEHFHWIDPLVEGWIVVLVVATLKTPLVIVDVGRHIIPRIVSGIKNVNLTMLFKPLYQALFLLVLAGRSNRIYQAIISL